MPLPGSPLYSSDVLDQSVGTVVNAEPAPQGGFDLLAVIQLDSVQLADLYLDKSHNAALRVADLPYSVQPKAQTP